MRQHRPLLLSLLVILVPLAAPGASSAQLGHRFTLGLMAGFGGTTGSQPASTTAGEPFLREDAFELGYQLVFNMDTGPGILFGVRLGQLDVEIDDFGSLALTGPVQSELTYASLSGEYRLSAGDYQSGLYMGVGYYGVDGKTTFADDTGLGLAMGVTGDFRLKDRWSVLIEFSGHYANIEYAQFFLMGHAGVAFHF